MTLTFPEALRSLAPVDSPIAGRRAELDGLRAAWSRAVAGHGGTILVSGEPGVGKTRLVVELACEAEAGGARVLVGRCPAAGAGPYHALVEALGPIRPAGGSQDRDAMFSALADRVAGESRVAPVLLVLDGLHAADRPTVLALRRIVEVAGANPILVLGTYREAGIDRSHPLADLLDVPSVGRIALDGLDANDLTELFGDARLAQQLFRRSGGNPVVVSELLRLRALDVSPSPAVDRLVLRRFEELDAASRAVVEAAAVACGRLSPDLVAAVAERSADRARAALDRAAAAGFVVAVDDAAGPRQFVHELVREVIVRNIEPAVRVRLHRRAGRALEQHDPGAPAALIAHHFRAAAPVGGSPAVVRASTRAGDGAMDVLAWEEAAVHFGHAVAAASRSAPAIRADLLLSLGEAQRLAGEAARARQAFLEAAAVARRSRDGARLAAAALALGQVDAVWGVDPVLAGLAAEARALLGRDHDAPGPVVTAPFLASEEFFASGDLYDALDGVTPPPSSPPRPVSPRPAAPPDDGNGLLLRARHTAMRGPEHVRDRLATADEMVALAAGTGSDELALAGRGARVLALLELGQVGDALVEQAAHAAIAGRLGRTGDLRDAATWSAMRAVLEGREDDARSALDDAELLGREVGDPDAATSTLVQRWEMALVWADADSLVAVADECGAAARSGAGLGTRTWRAMAALALVRAGQHDLAAEELRRAAGGGLGQLARDPSRLHALSCLAETAWVLADADAAAAVLPLLAPFADQSVVVGRGLVWRGPVARACGLAQATTGRLDDAERHLQAALAAHRAAHALPLLARTSWEQSVVLSRRGRRGDRRRASDAARVSAAMGARLGMRVLSPEARAAT